MKKRFTWHCINHEGLSQPFMMSGDASVWPSWWRMWGNESTQWEGWIRIPRGFFLLTNDGDFANRVSHPKRHVAKTYRVTVRPSVTEDQLNQISTGIVIDGRRTAPAKVRVLQEEPGRVVLEIVLYEGRNREIRKMCEALGLEVARLKRIAVGPVRLGMLPQGKYRELTKEELRALNAEIKKGEGNDDPSKSDGKSGRRTGTVGRRRR